VISIRDKLLFSREFIVEKNIIFVNIWQYLYHEPKLQISRAFKHKELLTFKKTGRFSKEEVIQLIPLIKLAHKYLSKPNLLTKSNYSKWEEHFETYFIFKEKYHREPSQSLKSESLIWMWCNNQRIHFRKNNFLDYPERLKKLNKINFIFGPEKNKEAVKQILSKKEAEFKKEDEELRLMLLKHEILGEL
jgi:hypothetical protein